MKIVVIKLSNGRDLICYRKDDEQTRIVPDELSINTTVEYLSLKKEPVNSKICLN